MLSYCDTQPNVPKVNINAFYKAVTDFKSDQKLAKSRSISKLITQKSS